MLKKETIVGVLGLISIIAVLATLKYLRRNHYLDRDILLYSKFKDTYGLLTTQSVRVNGRIVGEVTRIFKYAPTDEWTVVEMKLDRGTQIPKNAVAHILDDSGVGLWVPELHIELNGFCEDDCCVRGDTITGRIKKAGDVLSDETVAAFMPILDKLGSMDSVFTMIDDMRKATESANKSLVSLSPDLNATFRSARQATDDLAGQNQKISELLRTLSQATSSVKDQNLGKTLSDASSMLHNVNKQIAGLDPILQKADRVAEQLGNSIDNLLKNATLDRLINDPKMVNALHLQILSIDSLLVAIRRNPKDYISPGGGGKKKKKSDKKESL